MKTSTLLIAATLALSSFAVEGAQQTPADQAAAAEGLESIKVPGLDYVFARPGIDLSAYDKVMLDPVEISFGKSLKSDRAGGPVTAEEKQEIRHGLSTLVKGELEKQLTSSHRYTLVNREGAGVLRIRAEIRDLYVNAPASPDSSATGRPYAVSVAEMRLVAELRDAPTGALIARVVDTKEDPHAPWLHLARRGDFEAAARTAIADWARILRRELDSAHGVSE